VRDLDLSYECLTGTEVRSKLRNLRDTDPVFWNELTLKDPQALLPPEDVPQVEDEYNNNLDNVDDSDVPIGIVIENLVAGVAPQGYVVGDGGGFQAEAEAERFDDKPPLAVDETDSSGGKELGRGRRYKQANRLYGAFWRHNDSDPSDAEDS
jgi:hypothetical protein